MATNLTLEELRVGDKVRLKLPWWKKFLEIGTHRVYTVAKDDAGAMWFKDWKGAWSMRFEWFRPNLKNPIDTYNHIEDFEKI